MARLDTLATLKEFRTRAAGTKNLSIRYEEDLAVPYATRTEKSATIVLPLPSAEWDEARWIDWEFAAEHELGHLMPSCVDAYEVIADKKINMESFIGVMMNIAEDNRQEHTDFHKWEGRKIRLSKGRRQFWEKLDTSNLGKKDTDIHRQAMESFFVWDNIIREDWMRSLVGSSGQLLEAMNDQQLEWIDKLQQGPYESALRSGFTAAEEYEMVKDIITNVYGLDADDEEKQAQEQQKAKGKGEEGDGEGEEGTAGEDEGEEGEGECKEKGKRTKAGEINYEDLLAHNHADDEDGATYAPLKIHYDNKARREFRTAEPNEYTLNDYVNRDLEVKPNRSSYRASMETSHGRGLSKHVRRLLQVRSQSTYQHGLKRGKVSPKSIYRGALRGESSQRIYKKRQDSDVLNTAVMIAVDYSGSMGGDKVVNAAVSAKLLNDAISAINIPLEMYTFDDCGAPRHGLIKAFSKRVDSNTLLDRMADAAYRQMSGNSDGESILWGYDRLIRRKEKRKILIVLSDGSPACGRGDCDYYTKEVVREIEKRKEIDILGIGIEDHNVQRIYKQWAVINDSSELEAALLTIIEKKILD